MKKLSKNRERYPVSPPVTPAVIFIWCFIFSMLVVGLAQPVAGDEYNCARCGKPIKGEYFETNGSYFHPKCFTCASCGKPIKGPYTIHGEKNYHVDCFEKNIAKKCSVCGGIIQGEYLKDRWGNSYHLSHRKEMDACGYCGRYIAPQTTGGGVRYSDGRYICNICRKTAITSRAELLNIVGEVVRHMRRYGMDVDPGEVELHVAGLGTMQELSGKQSHRLTGFTDFQEEKNLLGIATDRKIVIYILYGLPRIEAIGTLAHELAHVWQFRNGRLDNDRAFCEGSCNYASYLVLKEYKDPMAEYLIANLSNDDNKIYGEGFRRVRRYAEAEGLAAWLDRLEEKDNLPRGY